MNCLKNTLAIGFAAATLAACAVQPTPPYPQPPPLQAETMPLPPLTPRALTWQPGAWNWNGRDYYWMPGRYVDLAGRRALWQPGFWAKTADGWRWLPPHWS